MNMQIIPHPYTFLRSISIKLKTGKILWFDYETREELPPYVGYEPLGNVERYILDSWNKRDKMIFNVDLRDFIE